MNPDTFEYKLNKLITMAKEEPRGVRYPNTEMLFKELVEEFSSLYYDFIEGKSAI